jgi:tetratricopeptide (TPR) repeat protein
MLPTDVFFKDLASVVAQFSEADLPRMQALVDELELIALREPRAGDRCYAFQARILSKMGNYEQALAAVERALQLMPVDASLMVLRGDIHRLEQEYTQAAHDYAAVVEKTPESVTAWVNLSELHRATGDAPAALREITEALKHEPRSLRLIYRRALIYIDLQRANDAIADLRTVGTLAVDPELRSKAKERLHELGMQ